MAWKAAHVLGAAPAAPTSPNPLAIVDPIPSRGAKLSVIDRRHASEVEAVWSMTFAAKGSPPEHGGDPLELSSLGGVDLQANIPNQALSQEDNRASEITCASMRADDLRACLVREIFRASAIAMQAQAALLDGDDDLALDNLRRHWRVIRAGITPLACELLELTGGRP